MSAVSNSDSKRTVLITGAAGGTGRAAVRESLELGLRVRAMVRTVDDRARALEAQGVEVVVGDFQDITTLRPVVEGSDAAYFVHPIQPGLIQATVNFAQAVKETGGATTVLNLSQRNTGRESAGVSTRETFLSQEVFGWSGIDVIHLRPTMFLEWLTYPWILPNLRRGKLWMPAGAGTSSIVAVADLGRAIAALLNDPSGHVGEIVPLSGPAELNQTQMAAELSGALGREIRYEDAALDEFVAVVAGLGVPAYLVDSIRGIMLDYQAGRLSGFDDNIEKLTGKPPVSIAEFARERAGLLTGAN
ncbi:NmrA family NAD(P)-binding protein [Amycolatopsis rhabdoformis]|uniref:NmrA family NAD(P)-binding protein n=1 Tax=Amycolatopsis rhabdoformis TaxID=1448059 RepID=A0ABZ1HYE6_9PSEU|nr:NmrA family NAD(P)-binding protein [Amycolatopsis rhabdoformis]WSE27194.1 NmrA family NAD(P)-binding protein [Amycolatopsis rhabdoformis]